MEVDLFGELAKQGLAYLLLAIVMFFYYRKDIALTDSYKARIDDNNRLSEVIEATNTTNRAVVTASESRTRAIETTAEAAKETADAVKSLSDIINETRRTVERNSLEIERLQKINETVIRDVVPRPRPPGQRGSK